MKAGFVDAGNFGIELAKVISEYTEEVEAAIEEEIDDTADKVLKEVKTSAAWKDRSGDYRKGFKIKKEKKKGEVKNTIYNKNKPQIVHLLEFGHLLRNGKRSEARPHMRPAYEKYVPEMEKRIEEIIKKGGKL